MRVAIVHYHLEPGGVTRVIENTLDSFARTSTPPQFVVLSGREYPGDKINNVQIVEGLDYSSQLNAISPRLLKERMEQAAKAGLGGKPDLWHIHNHSLGKNPSLTRAVSLLAEESNPLLLHPHDFAEDGRPSNFNALQEVYSRTYPTTSRVHYAALNHRDYSFLKKVFTGKASQVHLLPNAISIPSNNEAINQSHQDLPENLFLYPVRAVRRKNLGELALIAASHPEKHFANSLGPTNPNFTPIFERWKEFSNKLDLPISFGLGEQTTCTFPDMVNHANGIITTSIAEGFGLGFLEPWTSNKFLHGRNIPEITQDFSKLGINLDGLYERLNIDLNHLVNKETLKLKISATLKQFFTDYRQGIPKDATETAYRSIVQDGQIDFGRLDEAFQEEIILSISKSKHAQGDVQSQINLDKLDSKIIQKNKESIIEKFAQETYVKKLNIIYASLLDMKHDRLEYIKGEDLLNSFLSPKRLNLLRT